MMKRYWLRRSYSLIRTQAWCFLLESVQEDREGNSKHAGEGEICIKSLGSASRRSLQPMMISIL